MQGWICTNRAHLGHNEVFLNREGVPTSGVASMRGSTVYSYNIAIYFAIL